jgi:hypothetical protein
MSPLDLLTTDPLAQQLLGESIVRLAYIGRDGAPRVVPTGFLFTGGEIVICTASSAPKVGALRANPKVALTIDTTAFPPSVLQIRGEAAVTIVPGVAPEYLEASRKGIAPEHFDAFEAQVRATYPEMARIAIRPAWATIFDFQTRLPKFLADLGAQAPQQMLEAG